MGVNLWGESLLYVNSVKRKPKGSLASGPNIGYPDRYDQSMAQGSRASVCQRTVGKYLLSNYGSIGSVKRPVRTRMLGVVGAGGLRPLATRFGETMYINLSNHTPLVLKLEYQSILNLALTKILGRE